MMWKKILISVLIFVLQGQLCLSKQPGCPPPEDIYPCRCRIQRNLKSTLKCVHLIDYESLRKVIENSKKYRFEEVIIEKSNLPYLPHNLFEDVETRILSLGLLRLTKAFDRQLRDVQRLEILSIESVEVVKGSVWEILKPLETLNTLNVIKIPMKTIGKDFSQYVTKNLRSLYFNDTDTETIETGTFEKFPRLKDLAFFKGSIKRLNREMFPTPFNVNYIGLDYQKLTEIQEGLFSNMPNLRFISFIGNQIATIPEKAFDSGYHFYVFYLNENPIKCDCRIRWMVLKDVPVRGSCASPKYLQGTHLDSLSKYDFYMCKNTSK